MSRVTAENCWHLCWMMPSLREFEGGGWGRVTKEVGVRVLGQGAEEGQGRGFH